MGEHLSEVSLEHLQFNFFFFISAFIKISWKCISSTSSSASDFSSEKNRIFLATKKRRGGQRLAPVSKKYGDKNSR